MHYNDSLPLSTVWGIDFSDHWSSFFYSSLLNDVSIEPNRESKARGSELSILGEASTCDLPGNLPRQSLQGLQRGSDVLFGRHSRRWRWTLSGSSDCLVLMRQLLKGHVCSRQVWPNSHPGSWKRRIPFVRLHRQDRHVHWHYPRLARRGQLLSVPEPRRRVLIHGGIHGRDERPRRLASSRTSLYRWSVSSL